ncbi:hypothetical protein BH20CHL8_BH20CHL8_08950 [soil metagenome]
MRIRAGTNPAGWVPRKVLKGTHMFGLGIIGTILLILLILWLLNVI